MRLAEEFWPQRFRMQGKLIPLDRAIAQARTIEGPVIFTDAADATSSGATGDSNIMIKALREAGYQKRVLAQIVDPRAAAAAHAAGVGAVIDVDPRRRHLDRKRFTPMPVRAEVQLLSNGRSRLETMKIGLDAGPTAVLTFDNFTVVVLSRTISLFDRAMYYANGLDPVGFRPHRREVAAHRAPHVRCLGGEELQRRRAGRNLGQPEEPRAHDLRPAHVSARRWRHFEPKPAIYSRKPAGSSAASARTG